MPELIGAIIGIGVLILLIYGFLRFHWYCKDRYCFSPFNMFSIFSLIFVNVILSVWTTIAVDYKAAYVMKAWDIILPSVSGSSLDDSLSKMIVLLLVIIIIIGFILAENIKKMGVWIGIIGTVLTVLLCTSGFVMLWLFASILKSKISGKGWL